MRTKKYGLEPVRKVRGARVDDAAQKLAAAVREREERERQRRGAEAHKVRAEDEARVVREAERAALDAGKLKAGEMMRAGAWEVRVRAEADEHERRVEHAARAEVHATEGEAAARAHLSAKKADAEVIEKDRARWQDGVRREREAHEEEASTEAWRPKRG